MIHTKIHRVDVEGGGSISNPDLLLAQAFLKTKSGRSLTAPGEPVTAANIDQFRPAEETVTQAKQLFAQTGVKVVQDGVTFTLMGEPKDFEELFQVKMIAADEPGSARHLVPDRDLVIPEAFKPYVEAVVFSKPVSVFP